METRIVDRVWRGGETPGKYSYRISEVKLPVGREMTDLPAKISKQLSLKASDIMTWQVARESIDARDKSNIFMVYTVDFTTGVQVSPRIAKKHKCNLHKQIEKLDPMSGSEKLIGRPLVIGFGPCGIFAALELARNGYRPIVIERGKGMSERVKDVEAFKSEGVLNEDSNILFGEGGAGTFSDGKLTSGIKDPNIKFVMETFADAGAGEEIIYKHKPHIGTDVLRAVIVRLREQIIALGGEVRFGSKLSDISISNGKLRSVTVTSLDGSEEVIETNAMILATGHSARDTYELIKDSKLAMEQKPLSIGVRMEHPQELIDRAQYGAEDRLPPAEYKVSYKASNGRGVYSFCMCPGGEVVTCSTHSGEVCVNGMSNRRRDSGTANSGILCDVRVSDFESEDVLAGIRFQQKYERLAFENGGGNYKPPTCTMGEFLSGKADKVIASLPNFAYEAIREAVPNFAKKIHGYDSPNAVIKAVETRSSAPLRVIRDRETGESTTISGIYPAGEGCGYAGGITSAACDGIKQADKVIERFSG
nr:NAD(FAD)-utilizing dehydrogenase [uncultured Mogibacterium sp.]